MATRLIGTDDADPRLPALVIAATQGTTSADLAAGDIGQSVTWTSPISSGVTVGSGTTTALYARVGDVIVASFRFVLGTGSAITGDITLALPVTAAFVEHSAGSGYFTDTSAGARYPSIVVVSTTAVNLRAINASATYAAQSVASATVPFTWAITDVIAATLTYLAA